MKKILFYNLFVITFLFAFFACDKGEPKISDDSDIISPPEEVETKESAFEDVDALTRCLQLCYSYLPNPRHSTSSLDLLTTDEVVTSYEYETFGKFLRGDYSSSVPVISHWNTLFPAIQQCYFLLDNVENVPGATEDMVADYSAQTTFLIAYYHFLLLRSYGPIVLINQLPDEDMKIEDYSGREPYDKCVEWIADKFDEAVALGLKEKQTGTEIALATSTAAKALKARMLLYAASPLFNGQVSNYPDTENDAQLLNAAYRDFKNPDGTQLINTDYVAQKWKVAANAALEAIQFAESNGYRLYDRTDADAIADMPYPLETERVLRMTIIDDESAEVIWADTRVEDQYGLQNKSTPFGTTRAWPGIGPTLNSVKSFYTENGLPIDEDPAYYSETDWYKYNETDTKDNLGVTLNLNKKREPRFYAWVAYHNSYYEYKRTNVPSQMYAYSIDGYRIPVQFRKNDNCGVQSRSSNFTLTGYLNKKGVHPLSSSGNSPEGSSQIKQYSWPVIRLAELYLNYAEALIEVGDAGSLETAITYIDKVRTRAGIKTLKEAWAGVATLDQVKLRQIVRQERTNELYLENHRFWDVRRWMLGTRYFDADPQGMNYNGTKDASFFIVTNLADFSLRKFVAPKHYLMPVPSADLNNNTKLVQNPGGY